MLEHIRQLRKLQLALNLFNLSTSGMVFAHKLICLIGSITSLYFLVRLTSTHPQASLLFFPFAMNCLSYWITMWDNSSLVPFLISDFKERLELYVGTGEFETDRSYANRLLRSVRPVGVRVGGFESLERESTPIFMHFVLSNVASMLITF